MISKEKQKLPFLKQLSKYYNFYIEEQEIGFFISKMTPLYLTNKHIRRTLVNISKKYKSLSNLDFKALEEISDVSIKNAIIIALDAVSDPAAILDLHGLQFVKYENKLICIDPVYY